MSHQLVEVVFNRPHSKWGPNERAGFSPEYAHELLNKGIARKAPERDPEELRVLRAKKQGSDKPATVNVVFLRKHRMYQPGEVAGFSPDNASMLVDGQIAAYAPKAEEEAEPEDKADGQSESDFPKPPWGDETPTKDQFVAHYKPMRHADIIARANDGMGLGLDEQLTKAQLLSEVYDHAFGESGDDAE